MAWTDAATAPRRVTSAKKNVQAIGIVVGQFITATMQAGHCLDNLYHEPPTHKKAPGGGRGLESENKLAGNLLRPLATELRLEFLDAAGGVHEALLAGVGGMGIRGHITNDHEILNAINFFLPIRFHGRTGKKFLSGGHINKTDRVEGGMNLVFHNGRNWMD